MPSANPSQVVEFRIRATNKNQNVDDVRRLLDEAVAEAVAESADVESARAEIPGAFAGVGETLIIVAIFLGKAAAGGAAGAAGKHFYDSVLRPKLQKKNLVASDAKARNKDREGSAEA
jgi:hypothetical protein